MTNGPILLEQTCHFAEQDYDGLEVGKSLVDCACCATDGVVKVLIRNPIGATYMASKRMCVSEAEPVACLTDSQPQEISKVATTQTEESQKEFVITVYSVETINLEICKQKLLQYVA